MFCSKIHNVESEQPVFTDSRIATFNYLKHIKIVNSEIDYN
jgi:hypothetical protein